jgi:hypothetical protein
MRRIASLVTAVVAVSVSTAAVHLYIWVIAVGLKNLWRIFTFADVLAMAAPIGVMFGISIAFWFYVELTFYPQHLAAFSDRDGGAALLPEEAAEKPKRRRTGLRGFIGRVVGTAIIMLMYLYLIVLYWVTWGASGPIVIVVSIALAVLGIHFKGRATRIFANDSVNLGIAFSVALLCAVAFGILNGFHLRDELERGALDPTLRSRVVTADAIMPDVYALPVERGVLVFGNANFTLLPWDRIKRIEAAKTSNDDTMTKPIKLVVQAAPEWWCVASHLRELTDGVSTPLDHCRNATPPKPSAAPRKR